MYFQITKLILWPRVDAPPRELDFHLGTVNVITGASKTGKSAVIPIIDFCLGAEKCAIPVGIIRERCSWFGVIVETLEGKKLLARREPGDQQNTDDMFVLEGDEIEVPLKLSAKNTNVGIVKSMLNRLAGLTGFDFEHGGDASFKAKPSFRDLMAFNFQPQNIVANPDVMFFKADTFEHREKLKTIFPYVLDAITARILLARHELERHSRTLRRKQNELRVVESAADAWKGEAQAWLREAVELGLLPPDRELPTAWTQVLRLLRRVSSSNAPSVPSISGLDATLNQLEGLRNEETASASRLAEHRQRLKEMARLVDSSVLYAGSMHMQRDRLDISRWLRSRLKEEATPLSTIGLGGHELIATLCDALDGVEIQLRAQPSVSETLEKETEKRRAAAEEEFEKLNSIRRQISRLEQESRAAREVSLRFDRIERFRGRLEQALALYDRADQTAEIRAEIADLELLIRNLQRSISQKDIDRRIDNALDTIEASCSRMIPRLDAEWPEAPIRLVIESLTVKVIRGSRDDYLWEIGSGANWLAYHVALTVALQKFFLKIVNHPVPGLLIYDQPSQVYFPRRFAGRETDSPEAIELRDQDIVEIRKVFALLASEVSAAAGRLQAIVLDHADEDVWGDIPGILKVAEWRGNEALVPKSWTSGRPTS